jgi:hypothetical protein
MEPEEIAALRTLYVFTPPAGESWGLTYAGLEAVLRERNPEAFIRVEEGTDGPVTGSSMHFGITVDEEQLEGMALLSPEGVSVKDCTVALAAGVVTWLRSAVVPQGAAVTFNTEWGLEAELPDAAVPDTDPQGITAAFVDHLVATGDLD